MRGRATLRAAHTKRRCCIVTGVLGQSLAAGRSRWPAARFPAAPLKRGAADMHQARSPQPGSASPISSPGRGCSAIRGHKPPWTRTVNVRPAAATAHTYTHTEKKKKRVAHSAPPRGRHRQTLNRTTIVSTEASRSGRHRLQRDRRWCRDRQACVFAFAAGMTLESAHLHPPVARAPQPRRCPGGMPRRRSSPLRGAGCERARSHLSLVGCFPSPPCPSS